MLPRKIVYNSESRSRLQIVNKKSGRIKHGLFWEKQLRKLIFTDTLVSAIRNAIHNIQDSRLVAPIFIATCVPALISFSFFSLN